jgi:restriction system protein
LRFGLISNRFTTFPAQDSWNDNVAEIPDYQTLMLSVLRIAALGESTIPKAVEKLGVEFGLTADQMAEMLPKGGAQVINNRAHWAKTYLVKAGLLDQPRRGIFRITGRGAELLKTNPSRIDNHILANYSEFRAFTLRKPEPGEGPLRTTAARDLPAPNASAPPNERIVAASNELDAGLRDDLLNRIFEIDPISSRARFFERLNSAAPRNGLRQGTRRSGVSYRRAR